uniref:SHANK associated RH domain interactor n=1 Tax=Sphenodon punctatus TaxID=8508 RepID=A0A8D0LCB2_SPHPU
MAALQPTVPLSAGSPLLEPQLEASLPLELSKKEDLALQLSRAIELGDEKEASQFAMVLARQQAALRILLRESCYPASEISMKVGVEDAACSANITIKVHPNTTIALLRHQVFQDYGFHPSVQRWIIGQCLCVDDRSVGSYGIRKDGDTAFLYLLSAKRAKLSEQRYEEDQAQAPAGLLGPEAKRKFSPLPSPLPKKAWARDSAGKMDIGEFSHYLSMLQVSNLLPGQPRAAPAAAAAPPPSPGQAGWACPTCTFINKPTRPGCEMCSTDRPAGYVVPGSYKPDEKELKRMQQEQDAILKYQQVLEQERLQNFQQLLQLDDQALVPNQEEMECRICYLDVGPGQGVLLRECLHSFCS